MEQSVQAGEEVLRDILVYSNPQSLVSNPQEDWKSKEKLSGKNKKYLRVTRLNEVCGKLEGKMRKKNEPKGTAH